MTKCKFLADKNGVLCGFEISGHSSENCGDTDGKIVCSAVSSACYMAANTVIEIVKDEYFADIKDGFMRFKVEKLSKESAVVLEGLKLHLTQLALQYKDRIRIITEV